MLRLYGRAAYYYMEVAFGYVGTEYRYKRFIHGHCCAMLSRDGFEGER